MERASLVLSLLAFAIACGDGRPTEVREGAPYGVPCSVSSDCESGLCVTGEDPFCTQECADDCGCPTGAACYSAGGGLRACGPGTNTCERMPDASPADASPGDGGGVDGALPDTGPPTGRGEAGDPCTATSECGRVLSRGGTGPDVEYAWVEQECVSALRLGLPGGLCTMIGCAENSTRDSCPEGTACLPLRGTSICAPTCESTSDCREGWTCRAGFRRWDSLCWRSCADAACFDGLICQADGTCAEAPPAEYDVVERSLSLGPPLTSVDGSSTSTRLSFALPFEIEFFGVRHPAGALVNATWQGLFGIRTSPLSFVPGDHTRYEPSAPLIVVHHYANTARGTAMAYAVTGTAPSRVLEVEWETDNLSGTGGARFRLRFEEGSDAFVVHYGPITDDVSPEAWTQLAMMNTSVFEDHIVSTGSPRPGSAANTQFTYTPR